ncbi:MAG: CBS domain-containing protein [Planctomycetota bacterium]
MEPKKAPHARDIMTKDPVTLDPKTSLYEASKILVKNRWLSAPVVDADGKFVGVFSQQCCMRALVDAIYDHIPSVAVGAYLDPDPITTHEDATLVRCAQIFAQPGRRGPAIMVLRDEKVVGLISRLDIIQGVLGYVKSAPDQQTRLLYLSALSEIEDAPSRLQ